MDAGLLAEFRNNRCYAFAYDVLRIRLPRVDYVIDDLAAAEVWSRHLRLSRGVSLSRCDPGRMAVGIPAKRLVIEIQTELAELPQLIRNVFAVVRHGAVRTHDDLVRFM